MSKSIVNSKLSNSKLVVLDDDPTGIQTVHGCRARTIIEAIMWHGYSKQSDAYTSTEKFYNPKKADRDAVVKFIESI